MEVTIAGISARNFGSQGQQRSCALALKLAQGRLREETLGEAPIILLDDCLLYTSSFRVLAAAPAREPS